MIDADAATAAARARAEAQGWAFATPVRSILHRGWFGSPSRYVIETNAGKRGTKARFTIDAATGAILDEGYIPR